MKFVDNSVLEATTLPTCICGLNNVETMDVYLGRIKSRRWRDVVGWACLLAFLPFGLFVLDKFWWVYVVIVLSVLPYCYILLKRIKAGHAIRCALRYAYYKWA